MGQQKRVFFPETCFSTTHCPWQYLCLLICSVSMNLSWFCTGTLYMASTQFFVILPVLHLFPASMARTLFRQHVYVSAPHMLPVNDFQESSQYILSCHCYYAYVGWWMARVRTTHSFRLWIRCCLLISWWILGISNIFGWSWSDSCWYCSVGKPQR